MCARHGRGAIEICLSEKGALAKKRLGNTDVQYYKLHFVIHFEIFCGYVKLYSIADLTACNFSFSLTIKIIRQTLQAHNKGGAGGRCPPRNFSPPWKKCWT